MWKGAHDSVLQWRNTGFLGGETRKARKGSCPFCGTAGVHGGLPP